jgi:hypothetical protein
MSEGNVLADCPKERKIAATFEQLHFDDRLIAENLY